MKFQKGHKTTLGRKYPNRKKPISFTEEHKRKIGEATRKRIGGMTEKKDTEETKKKKSLAQIGKHCGEKCSFWKGGISPLRRTIRTSFKYRQWISDIFTKDDFICQECWVRGGKLSAHHIKSFSKIIEENKIKTFEEALNCEELWNINNGITLCKKCHSKTNNYGINLTKVKRII